MRIPLTCQGLVRRAARRRTDRDIAIVKGMCTPNQDLLGLSALRSLSKRANEVSNVS